MSQMNANMVTPLLSALPEEQLRIVAEHCDRLLEGKRKPKPKKKRRSTRDKIADQLGEHFREGNEDLLVAEIMHGN